MNNSLLIRQAQPQDDSALKTIVDASFPRFFRFFALHSLQSKDGNTLLGEAKGSTVGFAKLIWFTIKDEQYGCILWLAVHPTQHRKGYATTLVNAGTKYLQAHGSKAVFASATRGNTASLATFSKEGYSKIGFLGLWRRVGFRVFKFYRAIWFAPSEIVLVKAD
ncbi:MAG: GNAT family N-acetyltransferase [Candidatus Bathyarchaeota archaeon]|nr:GNAT family N-acetyltransferase [Candidatus Bathyarchaeota archaeon]